MTDETYNGWTNYETWNVKLWIDNNRGLQERFLTRARELENEEWGATVPLEREIREHFENNNPLAHEANVYSDLLTASLHKVNWGEIANSIMEESEEIPA